MYKKSTAFPELKAYFQKGELAGVTMRVKELPGLEGRGGKEFKS